jgi:hypothetical protein
LGQGEDGDCGKIKQKNKQIKPNIVTKTRLKKIEPKNKHTNPSTNELREKVERGDEFVRGSGKQKTLHCTRTEKEHENKVGGIEERKKEEERAQLI